jgi:hypothetical protein
MSTSTIDKTTISALKLAVGPLDHLRLIHAEHLEVLHTLGRLVGGSLESVAFLTDVPDPSADQHHVYWLSHKGFGCLIVGAHQGPQGAHELPTKLNGYVRPVSDIKRLELQEIQIEWSQFGDRAPELEPTVLIHFDDEKIAVSVSSRTNAAARQQADAFIDRLQAVFAARSFVG